MTICVWSGSTNFLNMHLASLASICQRLLFWCAQAHPVLQVSPDEELVLFEESPPRTDEQTLTLETHSIKSHGVPIRSLENTKASH